MQTTGTEAALDALDQLADQWVSEVNLLAMVTAVAGSPTLTDSIEALARQAFIEGAYRGYVAARKASEAS